MSEQQDISPFLLQPLRTIRQYERQHGIVRGLTEDERTWIMEGQHGGPEGFPGFYIEMVSAGGPDDRRYHMRTFFALLRERIKERIEIDRALEAVDYEDTRSEQEYWQSVARGEAKNLIQQSLDWARSRGCR